MAKYEIDTEKMKATSSSMNLCVNDMDLLLSSLVKRFDNIPTTTHEWMGNACDDFVSVVDQQYNDVYKPFLNLLRTFTDDLQKIAEDFEEVERNNRL